MMESIIGKAHALNPIVMTISADGKMKKNNL
jgi:hypothetical protein